MSPENEKVSAPEQIGEPLSDLRERLVRDFASAFIRIRGAHNPKPGEPCAWCQLAAEQAAEAVVTTGILARLAAIPATPDVGHEHYWVDAYDDETGWHCTICGLTEYPGEPPLATPDVEPNAAASPPLEGCICATTRRWPFYHLTYCPWRQKAEAERG
jgi:hypothetical protein